METGPSQAVLKVAFRTGYRRLHIGLDTHPV